MSHRHGSGSNPKRQLPIKQRERVYARGRFRCADCGAKADPIPNSSDTHLIYPIDLAANIWLTVDHVIPRALGGSDDDGNLVARCTRCNSAKGRKVPLSAVLGHP